MENKIVQNIDYNSLSAKGLRLSEHNFNLMLNFLVEGANEVKSYLGVVSDDWPKFNFANDINTMGYSRGHDAICLSINHLNQAVDRSDKIEFKDQLIMFIPDVFYMVVKYIYWLKLLGREATIHHYQTIGNPKLHVQFTGNTSPALSPKQLLFSCVEVEARGITDEITQQQGETPIWARVDAYFSQKFPQYYNKSIEELAKLPKPNYPVSYVMEYYTV